jgi:2-C-methyl-D-erythritol 4-phosphate cytidylyltransferase
MESVMIGISRADQRSRLLAIHDGARPLVSQQVLTKVITAAEDTGAAAPAIAVKDTIKQVDGHDQIVRTVPRDDLRAVQTPQVFDRDLIKAALQKAKEQGCDLTDDCAAVEALGMKVTLTPGSERNLKITTPADLTLGEVLLQCQPD